MKFVRGTAALIGLLVLLVGIPAALYALAGNPIPSTDELVRGFTQPDWTGSFVTGTVLPIIGWAGWISFVIGIVSVLPATVRGIEPPRIPGLSLQQNTGRALIAAVLIMFSATTGSAAAFASPANAAPISSTTTTMSTGWETSTQATRAAAPQTAPVTPPPAQAPATQKHVVTPGETLTGIAHQTSGNAANWEQIYEANQGKPQPGGAALQNPDLIDVGWTLDVPTDTAATPAPEEPAPAPEPAPSQEAPASPAPAPEAAPAPERDVPPPAAEQAPTQEAAAPAQPEAAAENPQQSDAATGDIDGAEEEFSIPASTVWGAGAIVAAGILSILGARRLRQHRRRGRGERIAMPAHDIAVTELELRAVEDPAGVDDVDRVLKHIAYWADTTGSNLPRLFALRLTDTRIELFIEEPVELPDPFTEMSDDKCAWAVDPHDIPALDEEDAPVAPWPALVTLGQDPSDGHILVDLERLGTLGIDADPETAQGALTALAIELASSKWSEDLTVTLVGFAPDLPDAFGTGRVRYVDDVDELIDTLEARAQQDAQLLDELEITDAHDARIRSSIADSWPPEIVLMGQTPDEETAARLTELTGNMPRVGIAAITHGSLNGTWTLDIGPDRQATLNPAGVQITAQIIAGDNYNHIIEALRATTVESHPAKPAEPTAHPVVTITETFTATEAEPLEEEWDGTDSDTAAELYDDDQADDDGAGSKVEADDEETITVELPDAPFIRVLGDVAIENAHGVEPGSKAGGSNTRPTEVITFLALRRRASMVQLDQALSPGKIMTAAKRNPYTSRARRWLSTNSDGEEFLPKFEAHGEYTIHDDVKTDWDIFQELVGPDPATASLPRLEAALELVTGQPFSGIRTARGSWAWIELDQQEMIAAISDVAEEVAERALENGDAHLMLKAATRGVLVNPSSETHRRHKLHAHALLEDTTGLDRTIQGIWDQCEALEEETPEAETLELIDQLSHAS